ncbi:uncharacterized protein LOC117484227 [Trematomus bernacchii]|uniref:uncharacterized protein LOC117484227 n=1 Tax=Trematomus bernacchii TaxID=40690 RepID=UPI001469A8CA|nr:uncharacterized protein LOC117484227 [Trematomus bernacchii]
MEEKIIVAVGNHPGLYDQSLFTYRDTHRRSQAWREVAETVGHTEEVCRTRWKSLRDRFRRENTRDKEAKRSGAASSGEYKPWRFTAVMGFLTPFLTERETSSNVPRQTLPPSPCTTPDPQLPSPVPKEESQLGESQLGESQPASKPRQGRQDRRRRMLRTGEEGEGRCRPLRTGCCQPSVLCACHHLNFDEDELFFRSLLPSMRRLSIAKRARVRFAIHKAIFEAELEEEEN